MSLKPNLKNLGPRLGKKLGGVIKELTVHNKSHAKVSEILAEINEHGSIQVAGFKLEENDFLIERSSLDSRLISTDQGVTVLMNTELSPELIAEAWSRELVNRIQKLRKDSGLQVTDRIKLQIAASGGLVAAIDRHKPYILKETLGIELSSEKSAASCNLKFVWKVVKLKI